MFVGAATGLAGAVEVGAEGKIGALLTVGMGQVFWTGVVEEGHNGAAAL